MNKKKYLVFWIICILGLLCAGCSSSKKNSEDQSTASEGSTAVVPDSVTIQGAAKELISKMTLEEKIGQLFLVSLDSLDMDSETELSDKMKENLEKYHPGGVILFSYNIEDREQTTKLISDLQENAGTPLFVGVDEEGGTVQRVASNKKMEMKTIPSMYEIGLTNDPEQAYEVGKTIASQISELGFNLDFAPVADICDVNENTEIGDRSFGNDPDLVSKMVAQEVKGLQENQVSATLKHFPGQGSVLEDTHKGYANLETTIDHLRENELKPFEEGMEAGADFVMMSHISVEPITQSEVPASLSKLMATDILRNELKYDGIIITDAMNMKVITKFYEPGQAALTALEAGVDMILMPDHLDQAYNAVKEAVENGDISEKRLNASLLRILTVKFQRGILQVPDLSGEGR